jgi:hypothetical protein
MAKLSAADRKSLPASKFAGPDRSYPIPDKSHAANAKARASQAVHEGRMSEAMKEKIDAKADKMMHGSKPGAMMPHEMPMMDEGNVLHTSNFKKGAVHPDSKGSTGMDGDGTGHWSGH